MGTGGSATDRNSALIAGRYRFSVGPFESTILWCEDEKVPIGSGDVDVTGFELRIIGGRRSG